MRAEARRRLGAWRRTEGPLTGMLRAMSYPTAGAVPGRALAPARARRTLPALLGLLALVLPHASPAPAQVVVDQGTFLLSRDGQPVGTERFTIRRSGGGAGVQFIATAEATVQVDSGERRISSALEANGPGMRITAYQVKESGVRTSEIYMTLSGQRFQARMRTPEGEELREYRASPSALVLNRVMVHHFHFLLPRIAGATTVVPGIVPAAGQQVRLQVTDTGTERISIAGQAIQARHLVVEGGGETRNVWVDAEGRVLRAVNQTSGFRAERRDPPQ